MRKSVTLHPDINIAVLDDDQGILEAVSIVLKRLGYKHDAFTNHEELISSLKKNNYDILVLDFFLNRIYGDEIVKKVREIDKNIYIIILTGYAKNLNPVDMIRDMDINSFCEKSASLSSVAVAIETGVKVLNQLDVVRPVYFSDRLKSLRQASGLSQQQLADRLNISRSTIAMYETDRDCEPTGGNLKKLALFFGVTTDYLLCINRENQV